MRTSERQPNSEENDKHRLLGLVGVAEDWHAKVCLLEVHLQTCYIFIPIIGMSWLHRSFGNNCTVQRRPVIMAHYTSSEMFFTAVVLATNPKKMWMPVKTFWQLLLLGTFSLLLNTLLAWTHWQLIHLQHLILTFSLSQQVFDNLAWCQCVVLLSINTPASSL